MTSQSYSRWPLHLALSGVVALAGIAYAVALLAPAGAIAASGSISGTVTDAETHDPIEKVWVCAYEVDEEESSECAKTAASGQYTIPTLPPGTYEVGFLPGREELNYVFQVYNGKSRWVEADPVTVSSATTTPGIDAALLPAGSISGKVTTAVGAHPVEEVEVCAIEIDEEELLGCAYTESDGSYQIIGLPEAEFKVEFWAGFTELDLLSQFYKHKYTWAAADPVPVTTGTENSGIDAALDPGGEIHGTVYSAATGQPLREILVCSINASSGRLTNCDLSGSGGQYSLSPLYSGSYKVAFSLEFREFFSGEPAEPDGYPTQFYNGKTTLAAADTLSVLAPNVLTGIDAHLGTPPVVLPPAPPPAVKKRKPLKCKKHFHKKKVHGKVRCVRAKGRRHHRGGPARKSRASLRAAPR